jgi:hypothetical protein
VSNIDITAITEDQIRETSRDRNATIKLLRAVLKTRSGKAWSVTGDRGTAWGWITIKSPPARAADKWGSMTPEEATELGKLLGTDRPVHHQGQTIPAAADFRHGIIQAALGRPVTVHGQQYWD